MASIAWDDTFDPNLEVLFIQHNKISDCMKLLFDEISNSPQRCPQIVNLLEQLEALFKLYFEYWEQLVEKLSYPSAVEQKKQHELFLSAIQKLKTENDQCNKDTFLADFIKLRFEFVESINNETLALCDIIKNDL